MNAYLWVALGSALGGLFRFALYRLALPVSTTLPWGTILVNILGCFIIGFFGTFTLHNGRYPVSDNTRLFVMVGICGGFTTFSSFSLQTFDLVRAGAWPRALVNIVLSVVLCFLAVALGHHLAQRTGDNAGIAQTAEEELSG